MREEDEVPDPLPGPHPATRSCSSPTTARCTPKKPTRFPDADRTDRGIPIVNVLSLDPGETITAAVAVPASSSGDYCTMATRNGQDQARALSEFASVRPSGLIAITLDEGDELGWVRLTTGAQEIILVTEKRPGVALLRESRCARWAARRPG